jgi:hypothetical protein
MRHLDSADTKLCEYCFFPAADINCGADNMCPGWRERRYKPFVEKQKQNRSAQRV